MPRLSTLPGWIVNLSPMRARGNGIHFADKFVGNFFRAMPFVRLHRRQQSLDDPIYLISAFRRGGMACFAGSGAVSAVIWDSCAVDVSVSTEWRPSRANFAPWQLQTRSRRKNGLPHATLTR